MTKKSLVGKLLVANPVNPQDPLDHSVILIISHTSSVATGLQINRQLKGIDLSDICNQLGIGYQGNDIVYSGGFIRPNRMHIVHSKEWCSATTVDLTDELSVTNDVSILAALAEGCGPKYYRSCAGCWVWFDGELDRQVNARPNSLSEYRWEIAPATIENVFNKGQELDHWHSIIEVAAREQVSSWF